MSDLEQFKSVSETEELAAKLGYSVYACPEAARIRIANSRGTTMVDCVSWSEAWVLLYGMMIRHNMTIGLEPIMLSRWEAVK